MNVCAQARRPPRVGRPEGASVHTWEGLWFNWIGVGKYEHFQSCALDARDMLPALPIDDAANAWATWRPYLTPSSGRCPHSRIRFAR